MVRLGQSRAFLGEHALFADSAVKSFLSVKFAKMHRAMQIAWPCGKLVELLARDARFLKTDHLVG